jgi:MerR family transcriptional regulator, copper efflux regulator
MDGYSISQVAERTGFPPSTLRFYEQHGLVRPDRTPSGYRAYDDRHIELLAFIGRAKGFGLSLEEITDLLSLLDEDNCEPVQTRLRELVDAKIADAHVRIGELTAFTDELQRVASTLNGPTPDGPCDDTCGCTSDAPTTIALTTKPVDAATTPIACTLSPDRATDQLARWHALRATATARERVPDGVRIRFDRNSDITQIAELIAAEQDCCRFFTFNLGVDNDAVTVTVAAPADARPILDELFGVPA